MLKNKVVDLFIDEDGIVGYGEYDLEGFKEKSKYWLGVFGDKYGVCEVECVEVDENIEMCFDYDGGEEEKEKFLKLSEKLMEMKGEGDVLLFYGVEYDSSWCLMGRDDWEKFRGECEKYVEEE